MKLKKFMERVGSSETGRVLAYLEDGLEELNIISETHISVSNLDIEKDKRFYPLPANYLQIKDVRAYNQRNSKGEYRSIPRIIGEPAIEDGDNV